MDYDKLIERLNQYSQSLIAYKLGADFADACMDAATALSTLQAENEKLRAELERMKKIMRDNGIMTIPPKYPGWPTEWNIPKPRG